MSPHGPIAEYLDALARELAFDPALARRVRHEAEDHLCEAVSSDPAPALDAEHRAVNRFGDPRDIAARYGAASLYLRMRKTGALLVFAIAGIFLAMKGRVAWYDLTGWQASAELKALAAIAIPIDAYALQLGTALALVGWLYGLSRSIPTQYRPACRDQLRRCQFLTGAAAAAVAVAVSTDALLTIHRLAEARWSAAGLLPAGLLAAEIILMVASALYLRTTVRRIALCPLPPLP